MEERCRFEMDWAGRCKHPPLEGSDFCEKHKGIRCVVTGEQATHTCAYATWLVCGAPLSDEAEGFEDPAQDGKHRHRRKEHA